MTQGEGKGGWLGAHQVEEKEGGGHGDATAEEGGLAATKTRPRRHGMLMA
jgi:hypothetical protein